MHYIGNIVLSDSSRHATNTGNAAFLFNMAPPDFCTITSVIFDSTTVGGDQTFLQQQVLGTGDLTLVLREWGFYGGVLVDGTYRDARFMSRWFDPEYLKYSIWYLNYDTSQYSLVGYQQRDPTRENVGSYYAPLEVPRTPGHYQIRWLYYKEDDLYGSQINKSFTAVSRGIDGMRDYPYPAGTMGYPYDSTAANGEPLVMTIPVYEYRNLGQSAMFTLQFNGFVPAPLTYIWRFNGNNLVDDGVNVIGSRTNMLTLNNITMAREGIYTCVVADFIESTQAFLIIDPP